MRILFVGTMLVFAACSPSAPPPSGQAAVAGVKPSDPAKVRDHLANHVTWPASRASVLGGCKGTGEFSPAEEAWVEQNLPDRSYAGADEVVAVLGL